MYKQAPLPFIGQKKSMKAEFMQALRENFNDSYTFVDLFGGSMLCSHITQHVFPLAKVVCNDYDDFISRLEKIPYTNSILAELRKHMCGKQKQEKVCPLDNERLHEWLKQLDDDKPIDMITITTNLCFSGCTCKSFEQLKVQPFYDNVRNKSYSCKNYLNCFEIVRMDWKQLFNQYKDQPKVCFIVDPPYFATVLRHYSNDDWSIKNTLDVMKALIEVKDWIYFGCDKSGAQEMLEWFDDNFGTHIMDNVKTYTVTVQVTYNRSMDDFMFVSKTPSEPLQDSQAWITPLQPS
jgi:hypothetical protein